MGRITFLISILIFVASSVAADEPRYRTQFASPNGKYEASLKDDRSWHLIEKSTGKELYSFPDYYRDGIWFSSMTLVIGDDGMHAVAVNDYGQNYGEQTYTRNPDVLFFFRGGKLLRTVKLFDIAVPKFMEFSVSHFRWLYSADRLAIRDSKIEFTTFDLNHFIFSVETGEQIGKGVDGIFPQGAVFVSGAVRSLGKHRYEIAVQCVVRGAATKGARLIFESDKIGWVGGGFNETLVLQNGRLVARKGIIFNNCD